MGDIYQENSNLSSTLNAKFGGNIHNPMNFISSRNQDFSICIIEFLCRKSP